MSCFPCSVYDGEENNKNEMKPLMSLFFSVDYSLKSSDSHQVRRLNLISILRVRKADFNFVGGSAVASHIYL